MIDLHPEVITALQTTCSLVYRFYPNSFTNTPMLSFYQNGNSSEDNSDLLTKVAFQVDVWTKTIAELDSLVKNVDGAMRGLGFRRSLSQEIPDPSGLRRQTMRFEGTFNAIDGNLYSR
jgi:hypothetical protein